MYGDQSGELHVGLQVVLKGKNYNAILTASSVHAPDLQILMSSNISCHEVMNI